MGKSGFSGKNKDFKSNNIVKKIEEKTAEKVGDINKNVEDYLNLPSNNPSALNGKVLQEAIVQVTQFPSSAFESTKIVLNIAEENIKKSQSIREQINKRWSYDQNILRIIDRVILSQDIELSQKVIESIDFSFELASEISPSVYNKFEEIFNKIILLIK